MQQVLLVQIFQQFEQRKASRLDCMLLKLVVLDSGYTSLKGFARAHSMIAIGLFTLRWRSDTVAMWVQNPELV